MAIASTLSDDTDAGPPHPYRWAMLGGVWLLYFAFALAIASMAPLVYRLLADLGMDRAEMGTVLAAWQLTYIFSSVPCGGLLDRFGPRRMMFASILVIAASVMFPGSRGSGGRQDDCEQGVDHHEAPRPKGVRARGWR